MVQLEYEITVDKAHLIVNRMLLLRAKFTAICTSLVVVTLTTYAGKFNNLHSD